MSGLVEFSTLAPIVDQTMLSLMKSPIFLIWISLLLFSLAGCGPERLTTSSTSGKATFDGKPVTKGTIVLTPVEDNGEPRKGKSAVGTLDSSGYFVLTTYEENDGAILGKHRVSYSPPEDGESEEGEPASFPEGAEEPVSRASSQKTGIEFQLGVSESNAVVEIKDQENSLSITLEKLDGESEED